ncbi:complex I intermediate-associated protein 30-domain-containing protein [Tricladium varicosporioides]|nr:complex I intermediate-associated protein 30-domain-containing protein [Hymenoscyphus varicosporioides]
MTNSVSPPLFLFGGDQPWDPIDWTSSDDRVRGGSSISHLDCGPTSPAATFHGNLDIQTLGGAGFASQRTTGEDRSWDLSQYDGLCLDLKEGDGKKYTLTVKDKLLPKRDDGRDQSTVSWEFDFEGKEGKVIVGWEDLKATYRGRDKKDADPLNTKDIRRISLMMRSFFRAQEGDFTLSIISISVFKQRNTSSPASFEPYRDDPNSNEKRPHPSNNERSPTIPNESKQSWLGWLSGFCGRT